MSSLWRLLRKQVEALRTGSAPSLATNPEIRQDGYGVCQMRVVGASVWIARIGQNCQVRDARLASSRALLRPTRQYRQRICLACEVALTLSSPESRSEARLIPPAASRRCTPCQQRGSSRLHFLRSCFELQTLSHRATARRLGSLWPKCQVRWKIGRSTRFGSSV